MRSALRHLLLATMLVSACTNNGPRIAEGAQAPSLSARAHDGTEIDLADLGGKPALVYFYPKDGTPGCTTEACAFRDVWAKYEEAGVLIIGVSADSNESHAEFADEHELPFPLIADEEGRWAKAFGVGATLGMTARDSFLIGPDGTIAKVYPGVDPGVHAEEVLRDANALLPSG
ncbi:MAG: peroxiredoxin [Nannocystaceae bacterium]|nr:peroxiredoxin [bacterium]